MQFLSWVQQVIRINQGSGKSTFCSTILNHGTTINRYFHLFNLDPAATSFPVQAPSINITDLISLQDAMEQLDYGPNGGLIFCLEYLLENIDWLKDQLDDYSDDYLIIDCPGQIELYTHFPIMKRLTNVLENLGYRICGAYLLDSQFIMDKSKYFSGVLSAMSAMIQLEIPHINVMSKMDLLPKDVEIDEFLDPHSNMITSTEPDNKFTLLNRAISRLVDEYNMVSFVPLNIKEEDSVEYLLSCIDNAIQYGEDLEVKELKDGQGEEEAGGD